MKNIWAIVPVKPLNRSKSRLAPVLDIKQRETFSREMLERTVSTLKDVEAVKGIVVISRDTAALAHVRQYDVHTLQETGTPELNASLTRAVQVVGSWNAGGVLVLASDIPLMRPEDINQIISLSNHPSCIVIAADRRQEGTNALLMRPPGLIPFCYGQNSFQKHIEVANAANAEVRIYESPTIALDVDIPEDLDLYRELLIHQEMAPAWPADI
nr:2-phospho-L-lactate guanylyltransferase [Anaerolineae bacterium]